ncbi:MAG: type I DNA topoisomerase, partial [Gemmatimonadales bacterium]
PFTTSTMQQEASRKLGFSAQRTMMTAQRLYEGIETEEGSVGLITYMRTDSVRVSGQALDAVREYIAANYDGKYLPGKPNLYSNKKKSKVQDAHEAIRPSDVLRVPETIKKFLTVDQLKLYRLIWQRFVASQMMPIVYDTTTIDFEVGEYLFRATGSVVKFDGYHVVYHEAKEVEESKTLDDLAPVPALKQGNRVEVRGINPTQHFTDPPPRYSEASLVKELEKLGIGRPSTYSSIISTLKDRHYAELKTKRFYATDLGETVSRVMVRRFPDIFNVDFTAGMENELDKVEEGEIGWREVLEGFYSPFKKALDSIDTADLIKDAHDVADIEKKPCPECGGKLTVKSGRFGPFIACSNYPDCRHTEQLKRDKQPDIPTDEKCNECGAPMVIKSGRYGQFLACTKYPQCKHTRSVSLGVKCPLCTEGDITERRTRRGRSFYGCSRYPECEFSTWHRPVPEKCPDCGFDGAEFRSTKSRGEYRVCLKCKSEFRPVQEAVAESG